MLCKYSKDKIEEPVFGICKMKKNVVSVGNEGLSLNGKCCVFGDFSCVKYFDSIDLLCAGDRNGRFLALKII